MNAVDFLQGLVQIPSLSGVEETAVEFLVAQMAALGLSARVDEAGNGVGVREKPDANGHITHTLLLLGHIDTVPGDVPVRIENGRLYGRGAVDAKGPLATFVMAAATAQLPPGTRLVVVGAVEEESATSRGARHVARQYRPDGCIIGEPSGWDGVTLGYKGRLLLDYELQQPMGHTAGPNASVAETAVAFWNTIHAYAAQFNREQDRLFDRLLPSLRNISTGSDGLTNSATMQIGLRLPPNFDAPGFIAWAQGQCDGAALHPYGHEPAFATTRTNPLARAFNRALRQTGARPRFKLKTGTSDMNVVGPIWQCPIVAYGPGDSRLDHTPQEHIVVQEYLQAIEVLRSVIGSR